jgi:2-keto-3-deoxy-L-rhamnonate aldolase RhmA
MGDTEYHETIDDRLVKIVQIEHIDAVNHIDEILDVKGIDGVVIGPYDLSGSMNHLGQLQHPEVLAACEKIVARAKAHGVPCGPSIGPANQEYIQYWLNLKTAFMFCGDDLTFVKMGTEAAITKIKGL